MEIVVVGGDQFGWLGFIGFVDIKFVECFGGVVLIFVIGVVFVVVVESVNNEIISIVLGDVGSDLQDVVGLVIVDQVLIVLMIYVDQGVLVIVFVDWDVVIY